MHLSTCRQLERTTYGDCVLMPVSVVLVASQQSGRHDDKFVGHGGTETAKCTVSFYQTWLQWSV
jgi:hypothetical protein